MERVYMTQEEWEQIGRVVMLADAAPISCRSEMVAPLDSMLEPLAGKYGRDVVLVCMEEIHHRISGRRPSHTLQVPLARERG